MFDKNLFLTLCKKYDVKLSEDATQPMIRNFTGIHAVTSKDAIRILTQHHNHLAVMEDSIG